MAQKPILRAEVYAHAMRASQNRKKDISDLEIILYRQRETASRPKEAHLYDDLFPSHFDQFI